MGKEILKDISFSVNDNEKIGIIGRNGCGKTTLFKMILGQEIPDSGIVSLNTTYGYLPQANESASFKLADIVAKKCLSKDVRKLIRDLDIDKLRNKDINSLSGGEKTKILFVRAILNEPQLLLLDEPTNFLDWTTIEIIENYLKSYKGAIVLISHDRVFLDNIVSKVFEINKGHIRVYNGNYSFYREERDKEKQREKVEYDKYKKKERELKLAAQGIKDRANKYNSMSKNDYLRGRNKQLMKKSKSMLKRIEKMQEAPKPFIEKEAFIEFDEAKSNTPILVSGENISKSFDYLLFKDVDFQITRGEKIALLGENGSGKSTLLNIILGKTDFEGQIRISPAIKIGFLSQEFEGFNFENTALDELRKVSEDISLIRNTLGQLMIRDHNIYKKFGQLSYGEKVRVALAKLLIQEYNMLIMDEPTNFLDIPTKELIEDAMVEYNNAILFISHDRYLVKNLATEIWEIKDNSLIKYLGDYEYYLSKKKHKDIDKVDVLKLELDLANISYKLVNASKEEREGLEDQYLHLASRIKGLKAKN